MAIEDVIMRPTRATTPAVSLSLKSQNDDNLLPWLSQMIQYLCGIAEDTAWQDLVTEFIDFEKQGPPNSVSSTSFILH